ncbi:MAG: flavin reductase family protein [Acidimicrobiia bacterium]|nr:flavin reductase family protein [Acidimicrobiia bacterium]
MIDPQLKRVIGQMTYGAYVVAGRHDDLVRAYTSTWTYQVSFAEPIVAVSVSPKHETHAVIAAAGWFSVSILAGDQIEPAQYFSYPGRRFGHVGDYLDVSGEVPFVRDCIGWLRCEVVDQVDLVDHTLWFGRVTLVGEGRLDQPALTYSSRKGWRIADTSARVKGESVRDRLLGMLDDPERA